MIGRTLGGYRVIEQIGVGGMATVYRAYDAATDRYVALKVLPEYYATDPGFRTRFEREARAIAGLEHIHILPVHAFGEENSTAYLVMRYMQAGTLSETIRRGPLSFAEAARLLAQIAAALDYAHRCGVLHRDVKPSNVLLDGDSNAYLTDFGIAKIVAGSPDLTGSKVIGTPAYMSPEQCQGSEKLTAATDQYSLGVVLYEMVTGHPPFEAETPIALIYKQLNEPLPPPRSLRPDLPGDAERVMLKALSKDPAARWPSCTAFSDAFAEAIARAAETSGHRTPSAPGACRADRPAPHPAPPAHLAADRRCRRRNHRAGGPDRAGGGPGRGAPGGRGDSRADLRARRAGAG